MDKHLLLLIVILLGLSSCTIYKDFPIDIYKPGETTLPLNVQNIAIISRNFKYDNDTLQYYYKSDHRLKRDKTQENNIDSIATSRAILGLTKSLKRNENFINISPFPNTLIKPHQGEKLSAFSWEIVNSITGPINADILISLETLSYFFSTYKSSEENNPGNEVITAAVWSIYDPATKKLLDRKSLIDTVYWDGYNEEMKKRKYGLPPKLEAIKLASEIAGENYAKRFTPSWQKVYRMYVIPPIEDFRLAAQYFEEGKWNNAINTWTIYTPGKFRKLAIIARYNIALAYEMKDDITTAINWINEAQDLAVALRSKEDLKMIALFKKVLIDRQKELQKIN